MGPLNRLSLSKPFAQLRQSIAAVAPVEEAAVQLFFERVNVARYRRVLGPELLQQLSEKSGLSVPELTQKLSHVLPQAVDKLTPNGAAPKA